MSDAARVARNGFDRVVGPYADPAFWRAVLYVVLDLPVAWIGFAIVAVAFIVSGSLAPLAVIILAAVLTFVRRVAAVERARARWLLGTEVAAPPNPDRGSGFWDWIKTGLKDTVGWRALGYLVVRFALGNTAFWATAFLLAGSAMLVTSPIWSGAPYDSLDYAGGTQTVDVWWEYLGAVALGLAGLALIPPLVRGLARVSDWVVRSLLGPASSARIRELEGQRSSAVRAADVDRRRIEQDLHDGAQVRLTSLAMQLGMAKEAIAEGADTTRIAELVEDAHAQAKLALREIRDLARGIHPAILTDRGLEDALGSMVGRLTIPVDLHVDVPERPSPEVESVVYFVTAEAVTNAVRHADSPSVGVRVVRDGDEVVVEVRDRGRGGAAPGSGTGLANIRERVEATGGQLSVQSPEGVGTLVRAVIPCGW